MSEANLSYPRVAMPESPGLKSYATIHKWNRWEGFLSLNKKRRAQAFLFLFPSSLKL